VPNRLAKATSLYLRQHADNPVDWYEWGEEAFAAARSQDKPIFLSVGYSACHWCHVMARESFEDPALASQLNADFISIKVDREERPDVDSIYMNAVVALAGQGGWPMSVFLKPGGEPFYGGTYFPPQSRYGMPSFAHVLDQIADAWRQRREDVDSSAGQLVERLNQFESLGGVDLPDDLAMRAATAICAGFDYENGGWGDQPKFPMAMTIDFLLGRYAQAGDRPALETALRSLDQMALGGIFDHLGGGFHRYSVDSVWLAPHFEKMLYDNALLSGCYLHAWQLTGKDRYLDVARRTFDYVLAEMRGDQGWFYAAQDADSEGVEGKYYLWDLDEVQRLLGEDARAVCSYFDVTLGGNFEGRNILHEPPDPAPLAARLGISTEQLLTKVAAARRTLLSARRDRIAPATDRKAVASWNALMLSSLAQAGAVLDEPAYLDAARANAEFLLDQMSPGGMLVHSWAEGRAGKVGFLEDYASLGDALLTLYEADFDRRWFDRALGLAEQMLERFVDAEGNFCDTAGGQDDLIVRPRRREDNATPSGAALATRLMMRLWALTGREEWRERATAAIPGLGETLIRHGTAFSMWLQSVLWLDGRAQQIAIAGDKDSAEVRALVEQVRANWRADRVLAVGGEGGPPLLAGRGPVNGRPIAHVCRRFVCQQPVSDPQALRSQLLDEPG
jgi:hypothetical protein